MFLPMPIANSRAKKERIRKSKHSWEIRQNRPSAFLPANSSNREKEWGRWALVEEEISRARERTTALHTRWPTTCTPAIRVPHWYYFINFLPVASLVGIVIDPPPLYGYSFHFPHTPFLSCFATELSFFFYFVFLISFGGLHLPAQM